MTTAPAIWFHCSWCDCWFTHEGAKSSVRPVDAPAERSDGMCEECATSFIEQATKEPLTPATKDEER